MSNVIPFNFEDHAVRVVTLDGEPWWVLADVCKVLEIGNTPMAARGLDDDEKGGISITDTIGRRQTVTVINESGLYSLVLTSRKPAANLWDSKRSTRKPLTMHRGFKKRP